MNNKPCSLLCVLCVDSQIGIMEDNKEEKFGLAPLAFNDEDQLNWIVLASELTKADSFVELFKMA